MKSFKALVLRNSPTFSAKVEQIFTEDLPSAGEVIVKVDWSGINYKDALAVTNRGKIVRGGFPFVPGIDLAGTVVSSTEKTFSVGDRVLSTGWGLGESNWGGYAQYQKLPAAHLVRIPERLTSKNAMIIGTAGLTAMLAVMEIENGPIKKTGSFLVTGATGGVGSFAVLALADLGYHVVASTGKASSEKYLRELGASAIVDRSELSLGAKVALDSAKWAGCIDSVGASTLEAVISQTSRHGTIAACGLAGGSDLKTTVFPFILRGVRLIGIDSNTCPQETRLLAWNRLSELTSKRDLNQISTEIALEDVPTAAEELLEGKITGRIVVRVS
ncbi:MAG: oxidoreductase [Bacteroidetes bacterium]|nr:oxidoreductase [Bacteroidota bacterium]